MQTLKLSGDHTLISMICTNMYIQICMCDCVRYKEITFIIKRGVIKKNNGMTKRSDMRWSTLASLLWLDNSVAGVCVCVCLCVANW